MTFRAISAGSVVYGAHGGDQTDACYAHPGGPGTYPGVVAINRGDAELECLDKGYVFHRYYGAEHGFSAWYRPSHLREQAHDAWDKTLAVSARHFGT
jgi:hypothetical protein